MTTETEEFWARTGDLAVLADRCEAGAVQLRYEAEHAAEVLADRAGGDRVDPAEWAAQSVAAAAAAEAYAARIRAEVAAAGDAPVTEARYQVAEVVATAAEVGGILVDGRRQAERAAEADPLRAWGDRAAWEAGTHPAQVKAAAVDASGQFTHVTDGGQVPFWRLGGAQDTARDAAQPTARERGITDGHAGNAELLAERGSENAAGDDVPDGPDGQRPSVVQQLDDGSTRVIYRPTDTSAGGWYERADDGHHWDFHPCGGGTPERLAETTLAPTAEAIAQDAGLGMSRRADDDTDGM